MLIFISVLLVLILVVLTMVACTLLAVLVCTFPDAWAPCEVTEVKTSADETQKETPELKSYSEKVDESRPEHDFVYSPSKDTRNENKGYKDDFYP